MSDGSLIATTRNADLQPLGTGGQLAVQAWGQITGYLRRSRSPAHAALFAEPNPDPDRGQTDWYAEGIGEAPPLESLPQPAQDAARAGLARLVTDIREDSDTLRRSSRESERFLGELLGLALVTPAAEHVRVLGGQPVLVAWGHSRVGAPPEPELLIGMLGRRGGASAAVGGPMRILGPPAVVRRTPWLARALAAASLALLALALLLLWIDPFRWFLAAPQQCAVQPGDIALLNDLRSEEATEAALRREIARVTLALGDRRVACPPVPAPAREPRRAEAPPRGSDAERARAQGAASGRIQVILAWDDENDLDLSVHCPGSEHIGFDNRTACGGTLDVDRNASGELTRQAVENIVFAADPGPGHYRIVVTHYRHNPPAGETSPWRVTLRREGQPDQSFTGTLAPGRTAEVAGFDIPAR